VAKSKNSGTSKKPAKATRSSKSADTETRGRAKPDKTVTVSRRAKSDRRTKTDRRSNEIPVEVERRKLPRREKVNRRRQIDPTTCERDYSPDEIEFMSALDQYKRTSGRMFPTCSEILEVLHKLGYQKSPATTEQFAVASDGASLAIPDLAATETLSETVTV